jgi:CubicO group peptidase (beta-lactamase class C family)
MDRVPQLYSWNPQTDSLQLFDDAADSAWRDPPAFESAASGLVSTVEDYFAFCRMMLNGGRYGRERILSPATVALMTSDQLTPEQRAAAPVFFGAHASWGLGLSVDIHSTQIYQSPGRFGWDGGSGTSAYTDPSQDMIGILLTQRMLDSPEPPRVFTDFWTTAYAAME